MNSGKIQRTTFWRSIAFYCGAAFGLLLAGCGPGSPRPVAGTMLLDGKPQAGVRIMFVNTTDNRAAAMIFGHAETDAQGKFAILNNRDTDGIPPGEYKVTFNLYVDRNGKPLAHFVKPHEVGAVNLVDEKYTQYETTPEKLTVTGKDGELNFRIPGRQNAGK